MTAATAQARYRPHRVVVCARRNLKLGSIQIIENTPDGEPCEQPCRIIRRVSKAAYLLQWPHPVAVRGNFFFEVETD